MIHRAPLIAAAALLIAGALTGTCGEANAGNEPTTGERAREATPPETNSAADEKVAEPAAPPPIASEPTGTAEAARPPAPAPSRDATKPGRKGRPSWPPPPELIA